MTRKPKPVLDIPLSPNLSYERALWEDNKQWIAGLDEAGRGAWAGPVVAAVVIFPPIANLEQNLFGVRDSKQMNVHLREFWAGIIREHAQAWGVGSAEHSEIDQLGILPATRLAMQRALGHLFESPDHLLIDALLLPDLNSPQTALIKGDQRSLSIAAASILAKTTRDALMRQEDNYYPVYGFSRHKGYGTRFHQQALAENGPCAIHRMSFRPLRELSAIS
ncbi:MAG: ribonuclease HII [Chloroflexi bacterium HGW-Chloroflexi-3]|nr:MAG: ribonuclease HII [Chloroflexi bacterium HGW-Chloroflexi-3]